MNLMRHAPFRRNGTQRGVTLLEMLLAVVVFGGVMIMALNLLQDYGKRELARSTARYMENIALALEDTIRSRNCQPANGSTPVAALPPESCFFPMWTRIHRGGGAAEPDRMQLSAIDLRNGFNWGYYTVPSTNYLMPASVRLSTGFSARSPYKATVAILLTSSIRDGRRLIEYVILTVPDSTHKITHEQASMAANEMGAPGGYIMNPPNTSQAYAAKGNIRNGAIRSAFGSWTFNNDLEGTSWWTAMPNSGDTVAQGAQLAYYGFISEDSVMGDYLYRVDKSTYDPSLNKMFTTLNLGSNNIIGADNVDTASMTIDKGATVKGVAQIQGRALIDGGNLVAHDEIAARYLLVRDHYNFTDAEMQRMNINNVNIKDSIAVRQNFRSREGSNIGSNAATTNATFEIGAIRRFEVSTRDVPAADPSQNLLNTNSIGNYGSTDPQNRGKVQTQDYITQQLDVTRQMRAATMTTRNLQARSGGGLPAAAGNVGTLDILTNNATVNNNITLQRFNMNGLDVQQLGECERGCGVNR